MTHTKLNTCDYKILQILIILKQHKDTFIDFGKNTLLFWVYPYKLHKLLQNYFVYWGLELTPLNVDYN